MDQTELNDIAERDFQRQTVADMMARGWPRENAEEAVDVALHAVRESIETVLRITGGIQHELGNTQAMSLAAGILAAHYARCAQEAVKEIEQLNARAG